MKFIIVVVMAAITWLGGYAWGQAPAEGKSDTAIKRGDVLWQMLPADADQMAGGKGAGQWVDEPGRGKVLMIVKPGAADSMLRQFELPVEKLRERWVYLSGDVKAKDVSDKPVDWNGIKVMLKIERPAGEQTQWPQIGLGVGTFDWQRGSTRVLVPGDATAMTLLVGLEQVSGTVWVDEIRITAGKTMRKVEAIAGAVPGAVPGADRPIFKGHDAQGTLRGVMVHPRMTREDLRVLAEQWQGNLIRWQLLHMPQREDAGDMAAYDRWLDGELERLDEVLEWAGQLGVRVVVDLHSPPGGKISDSGVAVSSGAFWSNRDAQEHFVQVWRKIAARYKGNAVIWGFDLLNEPDDRTVSETCDDWQALCERAARAVREVDEERTLIVEPNDWGGAAGFTGFEPLDLPRVVYSFHMYSPMAFTHQGVLGDGKAWAYPGMIDGQMWDKAALAKAIQPAVDFSAKYRVQIYVGEFSAARWAEGAERYLADATAIFEEHGWDWSYHAFREWQGWDLERGTTMADEKRTKEPGERLRAILRWMKMNQRPEGRR